MTYLAAVLVTFCFGMGLRLMKVVPLAARAVETANAATRTLRDRSLDDDAKAEATRQASRNLMGQFFSMTGRTAAAAGLSLLPLAVLNTAGLTSWSAVTHTMVTWQGIALAFVAMGLAASLKFRTWP